ncbi:hypothetical protein CAEBREN_12801 [Caenorhabditis brenneri]|uniref:Uncharacterized protein n=1 Tax=Caenorhabditis brenneri TaxID=135651 RepID=G0PLN1_CAEBE|nr:hypothetical protein CAEBREN_12801 [Caenorhabditis brenneri]
MRSSKFHQTVIKHKHHLSNPLRPKQNHRSKSKRISIIRENAIGKAVEVGRHSEVAAAVHSSIVFRWRTTRSVGTSRSLEHNRLQMEDNPFSWNIPLIGAQSSSDGGQPVQLEQPAHWSTIVFRWRTTRSVGTSRSLEHNRLQMEDNPFSWNNPLIGAQSSSDGGQPVQLEHPAHWSTIVFRWRTTRSVGTTRSLEHNRLQMEDNTFDWNKPLIGAQPSSVGRQPQLTWSKTHLLSITSKGFTTHYKR